MDEMVLKYDKTMNSYLISSFPCQGPFEDLQISYISCLSENTQKRRKELMEKYYFECKFPKCLDEEDDGLKSSLICEKCSGCVPISSLICIIASVLRNHECDKMMKFDKHGTPKVK